MATMENPALVDLVQRIEPELILAQVLIARRGAGFVLRHLEDKGAEEASLRLLSPAEIRSWVDYTETKAFRPLKSAPNLRRGWRMAVANEAELESALNQFYPNAIADAFAAKSRPAPVTHYREFTQRQTGMYRITAMLDDAAATQMARACCDRQFCLKQRLWTVADLPTDAILEKSQIPCLEPCALLLEFARKAMRLEQEERSSVSLSSSEWETVQAAVEMVLERGATGGREADFGAADNARRLQWTLNKLKSAGIRLAKAAEQE